MSSKEEEIFMACENGTYKYALQLSQKLIKKYPKSTYYQLLYNYVLMQSGKEKEATTNCLEIFEKTPNDVKSLDLLNEMFNSMGLEDKALQVYENAAKKYPSSDVLTKWFHLGCETCNYRVLQKASMAIKSYTGKKLFIGWAAFTCYLAAIAPDANTMEKGLFPKLGLKLAESLKPMQNEQEVYVLVKLLQLNGGVENQRKIVSEILDFSKDDKLDLELQIILLDTLDQLENWDELYKWSETVLFTYKLDDFDTWKYLVKSGLRLEKKDNVSEAIAAYDTRNSKLAKMELQVQSGSDAHEAVFEYLSSMGTKNCAFFDIKHYIKHLDTSKFLTWLDSQEIPKGDKGLTWEVNVTKFRVLLDQSLLKSPEFINDLAKKYNFYKSLLSYKPKTDFSSSSELILLIVQSLLTQSFTTQTLFISTVILENAVLNDEHEFHLRLWLIQLYTLLNCPQQARLHYDTLSIKNVQHDILDHYLNSRLATTRPVVDSVEKSYKVYKDNEVETVYFTKIGFNKGSFNKLEKILEFQNRLRHSTLKRHLAIQVLKMGRLLNNKTLVEDYKNDAFDTVEFDNRDMNILWNFGIDEAITGLKEKLTANIPGPGYNDVMCEQEKLITGEVTEASEGLNLSSLTPAEKWSFQLVASMRGVLESKVAIDDVSAHYNQAPLPKASEPSWYTTHCILVILDTCKAVQTMLSGSKTKVKGIADLKEANITLLSTIREDVIVQTKTGVASGIELLKVDAENSVVLKELQFTKHTDKVADILHRGNTDAAKLMSIL